MMNAYICKGCGRKWVYEQMDLFGEPIGHSEPEEIYKIWCYRCRSKMLEMNRRIYYGG